MVQRRIHHLKKTTKREKHRNKRKEKMGQTQALLEENIQEMELGRQIAIVDGITGRSFSYQELLDYSKQLAYGLANKCNVQKGTVVAVFAPNMLEWNLVIHATQMLGGIFAPSSPFWNADEFAFQLQDSGATVLFTVPPLIEKAKEAAKKSNVKHIYVFGGCDGAKPFGSLLQNEGWIPDDAIIEAFDDTDLGLYYYTPIGGGELKRYEANHNQILSTFKSIIGDINETEEEGGADDKKPDGQTIEDVFVPNENDKILGALPFWRSEGLVGVLLQSNFAGSCVYVFDHFLPYKLLNAVEIYGLNCLPLSTPMMENIALLGGPKNNDYDSDDNVNTDKATKKDDKKKRKNVHIILATHGDEDGIGLEDDVLDQVLDYFNINKESIKAIEFMAAITFEIDPEPIEYPVTHATEPYLHTSFFLNGNDLPATMHVIGWEGNQSQLLNSFNDKKHVKMTSVNGGILYEVSGNWSRLFAGLGRAHRQSHETMAIDNKKKGKEPKETIVKTTVTLYSKTTILNVDQLIEEKKKKEHIAKSSPSKRTPPRSAKKTSPFGSGGGGGGNPLLAAIRNKGGSNSLIKKSSSKAPVVSSPSDGSGGGNPLLAAIRNKGDANSLKKKQKTPSPLGNDGGGSPLLAAIRNKGGANSLKKKKETSETSSPDGGGSPLLAAIRNKGGANSLKKNKKREMSSEEIELKQVEAERDRAKESLNKVREEIQNINKYMALEAQKLQEEKEKLELIRKNIIEQQRKQKDLEMPIEDIELNNNNNNDNDNNNKNHADTFAPPKITKPLKMNSLKDVKTISVRSATPTTPRSRRSSKQSNADEMDFTQEDYAIELREDIDALLKSGREHYQRREFQKGEEIFEEAKEIAIELKDKLLEGKALSNLASLQEAMGNSHAAIDNNMTCIKIFQDLGEVSKETYILYNLSHSYKSLERYDEAIDYLNQCLELAEDDSKIKKMAMTELTVVRDSMVNDLEEDEEEEEGNDYSSDDDSGTGSSGVEVAEFGL